VNLLLLDAAELDAGDTVTLADGRARHLREVLRVVPGQTVRAGVVDGPLGSASVVEVHADRVMLDAAALRCAAVPARPRVDLVLAMPRPKVFARLLSALAAVGVGRVMVTNAAKVERYYFDCHQLEPEAIRLRLIAGLVQARDTRMPLLTLHRSFRKLVEHELPQAERRLLADVDDRLPRVAAACGDLGAEARVLVAVGPEGGWVDFERGLLVQAGFSPVSFGARVLAADVASVLALGLVHDALRR
jgi:RsmE family RNA methyltransferase